MTWNVLNQEIKRFQAEQILAEVVSILDKHPEWTNQDPRLIQLIEQAKRSQAA